MIIWYRTKLKQIEQECALLKKCCETLSEENRRLKKELRETRCSSKPDHHQQQPQLPPSFYIRYSSKTETRHRCDNIGKKEELKDHPLDDVYLLCPTGNICLYWFSPSLLNKRFWEQDSLLTRGWIENPGCPE
nr:homeobox-leucine zipper protein HAT22-like [Tanacetum cinerariifolium]